MNEQVKSLLSKRKDRSIAILLGYKERECDTYLPVAVRAELRKKILDQMNDFYELALDLMGSMDDSHIQMNQLFLDKLDSIYEAVSGG